MGRISLGSEPRMRYASFFRDNLNEGYGTPGRVEVGSVV